MPGILMGPLEVAGTLPDRSRDWVIRVLRKHSSHKPWHPFLHGVRVRVNQSTDAKDCSVSLADGLVVLG